MTKTDQRRSAEQRILPLRARGDLQSIEVRFAGQPNYVVTDPVTGEAFHLTAEEHALLRALRQPCSLRALQRAIEGDFAPRRVSIAQLQQFLVQLHDQGLVVGENPGQGVELLTRGMHRRRRQRWASLASLLSIKLGSFSAGPAVERLYRALGWLASRWMIGAGCVLIAASALTAVANAETIATRLPQLAALAQPRYWPAWIATIAVVKVAHELGHALACRRMGVQPQEFGVLLLAGAPSLYCDVTDAWRLPSKWQRMAVSGAGMGVELVIAAGALLVWLAAPPGLLSAVCLSLVTVCSVGTLLVNANPLMRYDGYYLLADWMETPNLADRSRGLVQAAWRRWLLGEPTPPDPLLSAGKRRSVWLYAILSKAYLALILGAMFALFLKLARPYRLENAVYTLAVAVVAGMAARPVVSATKLAMNPAARGRFRWMRLLLTIAVIGLAGGGVLMIPVAHRVEAPLTIVPARSHPVFAQSAGELKFAVSAGELMAAGDEIVRLSNPELELAIAAQQGIVRERRTRVAQLRTLQGSLEAAQRALPAAAAELADAEAQLAEQLAMAEKLVIRAPMAGRVLPPPDRPVEPPSSARLSRWRGSPLDPRNRGAWIETGAPLAIIADADAQGWMAWAGVSQDDVPLVEAGQPVRVLADLHPMQILSGEVVAVARRARSNRLDKALPMNADRQSLEDEWYHVVEVRLQADSAPLLPGARGVAKIEAYRSTLGELALHQLRRTFRRLF